MPLYQVELTVKQRTRAEDAVSASIELAQPHLQTLEVFMHVNAIPALRWHITHRGLHLAPRPVGTWGIGPKTWTEDKRFEGLPYEIKLEVYNLARDYPHSIWLFATSIR